MKKTFLIVILLLVIPVFSLAASKHSTGDHTECFIFSGVADGITGNFKIEKNGIDVTDQYSSSDWGVYIDNGILTVSIKDMASYDSQASTEMNIRQFGAASNFHCTILWPDEVHNLYCQIDSIQSQSSGFCGENMIWILDENGHLIIRGTGKMAGFSSPYDEGISQWESSQVKSAEIQSGVTSIGMFAFVGAHFESIEIADSIESIDNHSFWLSSLKSITLPKNLKTIGSQCFAENYNLTDVFFTGDAPSIPQDCFWPCENTTVTLHYPAGNKTYTSDIINSENYYGSVIWKNDCKHEQVEICPRKDPTCTKEGKTEGSRCLICEEYIIPQQIIPMLDHTVVVDEAREATCTQTGLTEGKHCSECNLVLVGQQVIPVKEHILSSHVVIPATCSETGVSAYWSCDVCKKLFSDREGKDEISEPVLIPKTSHTWGEASYVWSPDNRSITATHICTITDSHKEEITVAVNAVITSPTDRSRGSAVYTSESFNTEGFTEQTKTLLIPMLRNMTVMNLPAMLAAIEDEAFSGIDCEAIIMTGNCSSIGKNAFANCKNLIYVKVPPRIDIDPDAFIGCEDVVVDYVD